MRALSFAEMDMVAGGGDEPTVVIVQGKKKNPNTIYASSISTTPTINMPNAGQLIPVGGVGGDILDWLNVSKALKNLYSNGANEREENYAKNGIDKDFKDYTRTGDNTWRDTSNNYWVDTDGNGRIDTKISRGMGGFYIDTDGNGTTETPLSSTPFDVTFQPS